MNWFDAKKACDRPGVSLVFPNSIEEHIYLWEEMSTWMKELGANSSDDLQLWINCYRTDEEPYICSGYEGTSSFRNWDSTEPTNDPIEDCVRMAGNYESNWGNKVCHVKYFAACEMSGFAYDCRQPSRRYIHVPQQCLLNHQIKSYPVKESIGCGLACWAEPLCRSYNLLKQVKNMTSCQLNHASRMEADASDINEENCYFYEP